MDRRPFVKVGNRYLLIADIQEVYELTDGELSIQWRDRMRPSETIYDPEATDLRNWLRHHSSDASDRMFKTQEQRDAIDGQGLLEPVEVR